MDNINANAWILEKIVTFLFSGFSFSPLIELKIGGIIWLKLQLLNLGNFWRNNWGPASIAGILGYCYTSIKFYSSSKFLFLFDRDPTSIDRVFQFKSIISRLRNFPFITQILGSKKVRRNPLCWNNRLIPNILRKTIMGLWLQKISHSKAEFSFIICSDAKKWPFASDNEDNITIWLYLVPAFTGSNKLCALSIHTIIAIKSFCIKDGRCQNGIWLDSCFFYVHLSSNGKYLMCEIFTWNKFQCKSSALSSLIKINIWCVNFLHEIIPL